MSSFHVDARITIRLEYELATRLGEFILSSGTEDKQFIALGHKLVNIDEENENPPNYQRRNFDENFAGVKEAIRSSYDKENRDWSNNPPIKIVRRSKLVRKDHDEMPAH